MKTLLWLLLFLLLPFQVTIRAEDCKCVCGDVPDTLWRHTIARIQVDTLHSDIPSLKFKLDTIWFYKPVVLQPCPKDVIIDKDTFPALDSFPLATDDLTERKIIKDWMWWLHIQTEGLYGQEETLWRMDEWRKELDRYLREKNKE